MTQTATKRRVGKVVLFLSAAIICGILIGAFLAFTHDLPQIRSLETFYPNAVTRVYSADKSLLAELYVEKRDPVPLEDIPDFLTAALIATEDRKFYQHSGVDLKGITRAILKDIWAREFVEGASTITQQLAKTLFLTPKKTLDRKIKEAILAFQLERRYTKDEILALYLNQVYFGSGAYGVQSAARTFFGKSVSELSLSECALIAAMPKSPSRYSPLVNPELALKRRDLVLKQMAATGVIDQKSYRDAVSQALELDAHRKTAVKAPYFIDHIVNQLEEDIGSARLYKGGLSIFTTLDTHLQSAAEDAVSKGLLDLENRMLRHKLNERHPQAALLALELPSGAISAMVGGRDHNESPYNRATQALRQPGSAFKPILYALAVEKGYAQNKIILDAPVAYKGAPGQAEWRPENFSQDYKGEMTLRKALAISQNIPAVRLLEMLGPRAMVDFGHQLGIESPLNADLSLALGTSETTLMELTAAYAVFPNMGHWIKPHGVLTVQDRAGRTIWQAKPDKRAVLSRESAAIVTNMLEGVIHEGTGRKASRIGKQIAGKTGTTSNYRDALFVGFSPSIVTGVWVGNDSGATLGKNETGARAALPIWIDFMQAASKNDNHQYFDIPDNVIRTRMNPISGLPASQNDAAAVKALFKKGTEPRNR